MARLLPAIRKLCRYDRPKHTAERLPVSFGWLDHRHHLIGFQRIGLPSVKGRRASFAAHIVVAEAEALTEADIASTFGSDFWWSGLSADEFEAVADKKQLELPAITVEELLDGRVEDDASAPGATMSLAHELLTLPEATRLAVRDDEEEFGAALRVVSRQLPEALKGISLSTYEGAATFPFRVFGTLHPQARARECVLSEPGALDTASYEVLERLIGSAPEHRLLRSAARAVSAKGEEQGGGALWRAASRLVALATREEAMPDAAEGGAIADPAAIAYLVNEEVGRATLAEALRVDAPGVRQGLGVASREMPSVLLDALCAAVGERYASTSELAGCAGLAAKFPPSPAREAMLEEILRVALADEHAASGLGGDDAALLVSLAARRGLSANTAAGLLRSVARHIERCVPDTGLPSAYLATMFRVALAMPENAAALARALGLRPAILATTDMSEEEKEQCLNLLERVPADLLETVLPALLASVAEPAWESRLEAVLGRLHPRTAGHCIVAAAKANSALGKEMPPSLSEICDRHAAMLLERREGPLALDLLTVSRSGDHPLAAQLLQSTIRPSGDAAVSTVRRAASLTGDELRTAIIKAGLDRAVEDVVQPADVSGVWRLLADVHHGASVKENLARLLEHALRCRRATSGAAILAWIALALLPAQPKLLGRGGRLRERDVDELARELVTTLPEWCMEEMDPYLAYADRRPTGWWEGLKSHQRKLARRREKSRR